MLCAARVIGVPRRASPASKVKKGVHVFAIDKLQRNHSADALLSTSFPHRDLKVPPKPIQSPEPPARLAPTVVRPAAAPAVAPTPPHKLTVAVDAEALVHRGNDARFRSSAAMHMVQKFLQINGASPQPLVEVVLLCHAPNHECRQMLAALRQARLNFDRVLFTRHRALHGLLQPFDACLYLSCDPVRARSAVTDGVAAGCFFSHHRAELEDLVAPNQTLCIALDFDGVLADSTSQRVYNEGGLDAFQQHEHMARDTPLSPGPAHGFGLALCQLRDQLALLREGGADIPMDVRIGVVTARGAGAIERLFCTLEAWHMQPDDVFCLAGHDKTPFVNGMQADLFLDDDPRHVERASATTLAVHVPSPVEDTDMAPPHPTLAPLTRAA